MFALKDPMGDVMHEPVTKIRPARLLVPVLAFFILTAAAARAEYIVKKDTVNGGGGAGSSAGYILMDALAQPGPTGFSSNGYLLQAGFWNDDTTEGLAAPPDDNDGMPAQWEIDNGLDPYDSSDAAEDPDGDGLNNLEEYNNGTDPMDSDSDDDGLSDGEEVSYGTDPGVADDDLGLAVLSSPEDGSTEVSLCPELAAGYRYGAFAENHRASQWQIGYDDAFSSLALDITSESVLLGLTSPDLVLQADTRYYWRIRFADADGYWTWADAFGFTTTASNPDDADGDGIPDRQTVPGDEIAIEVDSEEGWADNITVIAAEYDGGGEVQVAIRLSDDGSALTAFQQMSDIPEDAPGDLDLGLLALRITNPSPGFSTEVRIYFSDPVLSGDSLIYKYDTVTGWYDYTAYTEIPEDLSCLTLELTDGGYGDADGVANGVIVDPFGTGTTGSSDPEDTGDDETTNTSSFSGGGGCFISTML
jgi:hypothetical protein